MTKEDVVKEFDRLIKAHYSDEIDSRDEWLREIIDLKDNVVKSISIDSENVIISKKEYDWLKKCEKDLGGISFSF